MKPQNQNLIRRISFTLHRLPYIDQSAFQSKSVILRFSDKFVPCPGCTTVSEDLRATNVAQTVNSLPRAREVGFMTWVKCHVTRLPLSELKAPEYLSDFLHTAEASLQCRSGGRHSLSLSAY